MNRGTDHLPEIFRRVRSKCPDAIFLLTGSPPTELTKLEGVVLLGYLDDRALPLLINAVNVSCIITSNTRFGRYSYPAKLCEAMACGTPVVATATDPVRWMLRKSPRSLVPTNDPIAFSEQVIKSLEQSRVAYGRQESWYELSEQFESMLRETITA